MSPDNKKSMESACKSYTVDTQPVTPPHDGGQCRTLLSIVIPIYNAAKHIPTLIEVLEAQGAFSVKNDIEVIMVNDGSKDNSQEIIQDYQKKYPQIRLINQENQGQSVTRNACIKNATGKYLYLMDQDDCLVPDSLKKLTVFLQSQDAEILVFKYKCIQPEEKPSWKDLDLGEISLESAQSGLDFIVNSKGFICGHSSVWTRIYNREYLINNNLYFDPNTKIDEDYVYNWTSFYLAKKVIMVKNLVYLWVQYPTSLSHNQDLNHRKKIFTTSIFTAKYYQELYKDIENVDYPESETDKKLKALRLLEIASLWRLFGFWGFVIKHKGLSYNRAKELLNQSKEWGIYPICHTMPADIDKSYPKTRANKLFWWLISWEPILKLMIRLRLS